ncbi:hypothetical protein E8E13_004005 [Curvularia kusanoi]|uniref:Uncharacterized protein n=1 Tax=Curvularia kusanoi TaxID=90978 RepID=A0A9P4W4C8_CURKU|nr:hypothetical protein E8E13_004005 [Curvularia kusanoi]
MPVEDCRSVIKGQKPPVTTKQLKNHGIIFKEATTTVDHLEAWLQPIYHSLTRIPDQFPRRSHKVFGKELQKFKQTGQDRQHDDVKSWCLAPEKGSVHLDESFNDEAERSQVREHHKESQDVAMAVRSYIDTGESEPKWHKFLENRIFLDFETARKGSDKFEKKLEGWEVHSEVLFNGIPRRRAVSLGPAHEDSESEESDAPISRHQYRTPQGKERPNLPYSKTAPAALNKTSAHFNIPRITYDDLTQHDREDSSTSSDEGYASTCISGGRSRSRVNRGDLCDFDPCEETSEEDPDDAYVPPSSSDEDGDSDDGEDEDSEAFSESEDDEISEEEVEDIRRAAERFLRPESQEYYFELPDRSIHNSRVDVQLTPTKGSRRLSVSSERRSKKDKRGSARF